MTTQVAQDLRAAAEVLRRDGWTQEMYIKPSGCRCVSGALIWAVSDGAGSTPRLLEPEVYGRYSAARKQLARVIGDEFLASYNDAPERTADEVIAALEAAADAAEAQQ